MYEFCLERHVPQDHLLRAVDRVIDLEGVRMHLKEHYSSIGRPSICPELLIRTLLVGYCLGIRSERRLVRYRLNACGSAIGPSGASSGR